tara:strand:- start:19 stop:1320 length:1302 start_codon:yes stop_codon:yes gene_type:complete
MRESKIKKEFTHYLENLFPLNRSLTGKDNVKTLKILKKIIPINIKKIQSGSKVYDWTIPQEWNISDAYILDKNGKVLISYKNNNLHVVGYSKPINKYLQWSELRKKLFYLENDKDAIPYRTSYYNHDWGFCVSKNQFKKIKISPGPYKVVIDSEFKKGDLTYGDFIVKGTSKREILISTYFCHPSMANDNLSGVLVSAFLAREMKKIKTKWSYRFIFVPETIGAIAYCNLYEKKLKNIDVGLVITTVGGKGKFGYKQSWNKDHQINNEIEKILNKYCGDFIIYPFSIRGSDERQYSSQGFQINTASITKDKYFDYEEYHTSLDNLSYVSSNNLFKSLKLYNLLLRRIEKWEIYEVQMKNCEYMLSKRKLYPKLGGSYKENHNGYTNSDLIQWILYLSDGKKNIDYISSKLGVKKNKIKEICQLLVKKKLLKKI